MRAGMEWLEDYRVKTGALTHVTDTPGHGALFCC
jgi:hypothetical protein